jgi:DNA-binding SARP family transcriptional activator/TolB-like protein
VEAGVVSTVGIGVESPGTAATVSGPPPGLDLRLLGPLEVRRAGEPLPLPPSRKVRALLAYLAMSGRATTRSHLCELLWDAPSDPRGELRWCLSKLRLVLDTPGRRRVVADGDAVSLDLSDCSVDALDALRGVQQGVTAQPAERLQQLAGLFAAGDFLEGLELPRSPGFTGWLVAERRHLRAVHTTLLDHWVQALPLGSAAALGALERWLAIAPFDRGAHERLLEALAATGQLREGEEHLAATARQYEAEGQDWAPIGHAWRAAKARHAGPGTAAGGALRVLEPEELPVPPDATWRASIAVMPFIDHTPGVPLRGGLGDGMAHDLITRLARLRSMFVIAEGTMFALAERQVGSEDAGRRLAVDYLVSGTLRRGAGGQLVVTVQLAATRTAQVAWAEEFAVRLDDTLDVLAEIGNRIVTAVANHVEIAERNRAVLKNPQSLTAWEAHHRGLWHMFRFEREDNEQARHFFQTAIRLDPTFARPRAGLSFTHFQDAFLGWREPDAAIASAYAAAANGVMADESDPASHWALGRAMWLMNRNGEALHELQASVDLSPNFAMGHYTLGFVHAQSGDPQVAITEADHARALSPLDPLLFGMLASRALALLRVGRHQEAADWAVRSAARPNAHVHIRAIAMFSLALAGRIRDARDMAAAIRSTQAGYGVTDFLQAFRLGEDAEALVRRAATAIDV